MEAAAEEGAAAAEAEVLAVVGAVALVLPAVARAVVTEPVVLVAVRAAAVPLVLAAPVSAREVMLAASVELRCGIQRCAGDGAGTIRFGHGNDQVAGHVHEGRCQRYRAGRGGLDWRARHGTRQVDQPVSAVA